MSYIYSLWLATNPDGKLPTNQKLKDKKKSIVKSRNQYLINSEMYNINTRQSYMYTI
jgi:hypothetical protein